MVVNNRKVPKRPRVCFISANAYPLLSGKPTRRIIGPDVYTTVLAREFNKNGYSVSLITYWDDESQFEVIDNIMIHKISNKIRTIGPLSKFINLILIWKNMIKANADYYFHAGGMDGACVLLCKLMGRRYVYSIGSDAQLSRDIICIQNKDFSRSMLNLGSLGCMIDLLLANTIIVQNERQKNLLCEKYHRKGILIKMPFNIAQSRYQEKIEPPLVIWVGSLSKVKQPELLPEIAKDIPEARFVMIGGHEGDEDVLNYIQQKEQDVPNFKYIGVVPFDKINLYFEKATLLVNTSLFEGFPNAFIQAWMNYTPVVTLNADPDGIICKYEIGLHSGSVEQMIEDIRFLVENRAKCKNMGFNGRKYVEKNHDVKNIVQKYLEIIR